MFVGLEMLPSPQRVWLIGLWIAWACLLFGGLSARGSQPGGSGRMSMPMRLLSSALLVAAGWSWAWFSRGTGAAGYAKAIAAGMSLGFLGDLLMARVLPVREHVLAGMAAFGLGHVAYIAAGLRFGAAHGLDAAGPLLAAWAAWLLAGAAGWYLVVARGEKRTALHWVALPYALLLASTAGVASGLALQAGAFWPFAAGAGLFLFSDLILAAGLFGRVRLPRYNDIIWLTYGPGQMAIVYSIGAALALASRPGP